MVVSTDSVVFKLLELYRRANRTCQETCRGKLLVCTGLYSSVRPVFSPDKVVHTKKFLVAEPKW